MILSIINVLLSVSILYIELGQVKEVKPINIFVCEKAKIGFVSVKTLFESLDDITASFEFK